MYAIRWNDRTGARPVFADSLAEIAEKYDFANFDADDAAAHADDEKVEIELRDEDDNLVGWIVRA